MNKSELYRQAVIKHEGDWRKAYFELADSFTEELIKAAQQSLPDEPTPEILEALRTGSKKDYPSDELCRVRYAALLAIVRKQNEENSN